MEASRDGEFGFSPEQREVLALALREEYFAVPRETTLVELAETAGVSDSAVSQLLRRGLTEVLSATTGTGRSDVPSNGPYGTPD